MKVVSFFAGCGGLDLGFRQAGFDVIWANEYDRSIHPTYRLNHFDTVLNTSDIRDLKTANIPDCDGFIGGPPCQSWSLGGKMKGLDDERGRLFLNYIKIIEAKKPKFFVIENVAGIVSDKHFKTFHGFLSTLGDAGYRVKFSVLNAADYGVPQTRIRVFIVGFRNDLSKDFIFPAPTTKGNPIILRRAIGDIDESPRFYDKDPVLQDYDKWWNHDCYSGPYDKKFMARNRVKQWGEVSFTIQAQARNAPLHPQAPPMIYVSQDERRFDEKHIELYRRLSVRECARIQTFPDGFHFVYENILDGYKMVGNAVPPRLAKCLALSIKEQLPELKKEVSNRNNRTILIGYYRNEDQLRLTKKNKLYYVRTGFRPGAMQMSPGQKSPELLLLHKGNNFELFQLDTQPPIIKTQKELMEVGFHPHGDVYLCFSIKRAVDLQEIYMDDKMKDTIITTKSPFLIKY